MDVSTVGLSSSANQEVGMYAMKKAVKVQEQQIQGVLQGMEQSSPSAQSSKAAQTLGIGIHLNASS
jgi:predicted oxidoreductase (fatty acid repression mutant protein)